MSDPLTTLLIVGFTLLIVGGLRGMSTDEGTFDNGTAAGMAMSGCMVLLGAVAAAITTWLVYHVRIIP